MRHTQWFVVAVLLCAGLWPLSAQEPTKKFRAGAYAQDITPTKFPISVNGGMTDRQAAKAHSQLAAAKIGWGVGRDETQVFNRRWKVKANSALLRDPFGQSTDKVKMNPGYLHPDLVEPAGPIDPEVSFLSVQTPEGRPL